MEALFFLVSFISRFGRTSNSFIINIIAGQCVWVVRLPPFPLLKLVRPKVWSRAVRIQKDGRVSGVLVEAGWHEGREREEITK